MTTQDIQAKLKRLEELAKLHPENRVTYRIQYKLLLKSIKKG